MSAQEDMKHVKRCMSSDPVCLVGVNRTGGSSLTRAAHLLKLSVESST